MAKTMLRPFLDCCDLLYAAIVELFFVGLPLKTNNYMLPFGTYGPGHNGAHSPALPPQRASAKQRNHPPLELQQLA